MIQVDLITGFLGSGKTTFLRKYARYWINQGVKIAILENDFGAVNVDRMLLQDLEGDYCGVEMIAGGCDKDCHQRRFRTKLISLSMQGYKRVLIEPSGIYDVDEFFDTLYDEPLDQWTGRAVIKGSGISAGFRGGRGWMCPFKPHAGSVRRDCKSCHRTCKPGIRGRSLQQKTGRE